MTNDTSIGQRIAYWRNRRGLSQASLAGQVGRSTSWLQKVEYGQVAAEKVSILKALANVLKVELCDLIGGISIVAVS
ncbi:MAG: helix-turn-helix domain-containing protein [Egibacteraceae bacterium]